MSRLSVNVNKIATLRNARGGNLPDLLQVVRDCEEFGAQGITVHPRPDERHIRYADVYDLKKIVRTEFNIEGYPSEKFINMVMEVHPEQVTLVPDPPDTLTSDTGWNLDEKADFLQPIVKQFKEAGIRVSVFMNPEPEQYDYLPELEIDRLELYTGPYAEQYPKNAEAAIAPYQQAARKANQLGIGINAGHDLNLDNLRYFRQNISGLLEVSIGHALICDALYYGLDNTIKMYLRELQWTHQEV
jgi:pyridoxine 5-phosphate synthase